MLLKNLSFNNAIIKFSFLLAALLILGYIFFDIVIYLVVSLIVAAILKPPTNYLSQTQFYGFKLPRFIAILLSFSILFGLISLFVYLFVPLVSAQITVLSSLDLEEIITKTSDPIENFEAFLIKYEITDQDKGFLLEGIKESLGELAKQFRFVALINNLLSITGSFFVGALAVLFITFFFLNEKGAFRRYFISLIPNQYFEVSIAAVSKTEKLLSNYLIGLLLQMTSVFTIVTFGLLIAGVDYAVTIGVFAAIANLIPFLGPILGAIFGLLVGLSTSVGISDPQDTILLTLKILVVFGIVQLSDNIFLQPIIFSKSVKAHPLVIFLIVFVGASISMPLGMIAAIPVFTIIKVTFAEFYRGYKQYQIFRS